ncbi:MAG: flagellar basal-body rod protein FlgF [Elusimicrobia bacterium RIFOXYB2_FULL_49_7]|nr:MAG: flagellar basal-body rod protein FlgF [Elusimicrobia bacterium RIFOXYB2_FULL_49_7]
MVKGLYTSNEGMKALLRKEEVLSNNLANVNTTSFKQSNLFTRAYLDYLNNDIRQPFLNDEHTIDEIVTDFSQGPMITTDNPLDVAIEGKAFMTIQGKDDAELYTRSGSFTRDAQGQLATLNGEKVLGEHNGPISINGKSVNISEAGDVVVDGMIVDRIKLVQFKEPCHLLKEGNNLYSKSETTEEEAMGSYFLHQGHLEGSNVNPVEMMVKMITAFRNYEADQRSMQSTDQTLSKAVNEVGRIR